MQAPWIKLLMTATALLPLGCRSAGPAHDTTGPVLDPDATLVELYSDERFFEGPLWNPSEGKLYFTAFGKDGQQVLRLERLGVVHVWLDRTDGINGTHRSHDGRMLAAQAYGHRVLSLALGGPAPADIRTLAADPDWNQPNDVCQAPHRRHLLH